MIIQQFSDAIVDCFKRGNKILIFGCGGSLADASHWATEFHSIGPVIALNDPATITAIANDYSFDEVFSRQVRTLGKRFDIVIGLSSSGKSASVIRGLKQAYMEEMYTIDWPRKGKTTAQVQEYQYHLLHLVYLAVKQSFTHKPW